MFRRAFWFTTGAAAGVWATAKVQRKLRALAPDALAVRAADKAVEGGHRIREFALDVRAGMAQRERELNDALGIAEQPGAPPHPGSQGSGGLPAQARRPQLGPPPGSGPHDSPNSQNSYDTYDRKEDL